MATPLAAPLEDANWTVDRATGLPEVWALVAVHLGLVGAWRLMRVCRAARLGAKEFLSTLPGLVVCGGPPDLVPTSSALPSRRFPCTTLE